MPEPIKINATPGSLVILRVTILSKIIAPAVIQPTLDHWVSTDGTIYPVSFDVEPAYSFLQTGGDAKVTFSIKIPKEAASGHMLHGALNIPSAENYIYPIHIEILDPKENKDKVFDFSTDITVPIKSEEDVGDKDNILISKTSLKLLTALTSLEVIPSKWIVSELVLSCCNMGYNYIVTAEGNQVLQKLSRTRFYKNGVLIFQGTQFMQWVKFSYSIFSGISSFTGKEKGDGLILQNWEEWLFNLIDQDVESPDFEYQKIEFPEPTNYSKILEIMETDADKWFSYFIIGLMKISPRIETVLMHMIKKIKIEPTAKPTPKSKTNNVLKEKGTLQR